MKHHKNLNTKLGILISNVTLKVLFIGVDGVRFSNRIVSKYIFSKKFTNLPVLVFLRLFGTSIINKITNINRIESINNYFRLYFNLYFKTISRLEQMISHHEQPQKYLYHMDYIDTKHQNASRILTNYASYFKNVSLYPRNIFQQALYMRDKDVVSKNRIVSLHPANGGFTRDDTRKRLELAHIGMLPLIYFSNYVSQASQNVAVMGGVRGQSTLSSILNPTINYFKTINRLEQMLRRCEQSQNYLYSVILNPHTPPFAKREKVLKGLFAKSEEILKSPSKSLSPNVSIREVGLRGISGWNLGNYVFNFKNVFLYPRDIFQQALYMRDRDAVSKKGIASVPPSMKERGLEKGGKDELFEWQKRISEITLPKISLITKTTFLTNAQGSRIETQARIKNILKEKIADKYLQTLEMKMNTHKANASILRSYGDLSPDMIYHARESIYQDSRSIVQEKVLSGLKNSINNIANKSKELVLKKPAAQSSDIVSENKEGLQTEKTITTKISDRLIRDSFKTEGIHEINAIADKVYKIIEKRISIEKERRGWR